MALRAYLLAMALVAFAAGGCKIAVDWKNHASYRSMGKDLKLAHIDPDEVVEGVVSSNLHYMTVALDSVFVRNLPGLFGHSVALGLELTGILPGGKSIQTVLEVKDGVGEHGFLSFDNVAVIEPFLYTGQNLTIALHFRAVPKDEVQHLRGRLAGAGDLVRKIHPARFAALETGVDLFKSIMGAFMKKELSWKYQFTLYPADSVYRDKPELLLTAARHILLMMPPPNAPSELRQLRPDKVIDFLRMRGNRLVWAHNEKEYTETPYIVLNITRYKRYPAPDTELRKVARKLDEFIEQSNFDAARAMLSQLGVAINSDPIITAQEKNLERSWKDLREARIGAAQAKKDNNYPDELRQIERQLRLLSHIRTQFTKILYPYETKDIDYRVSQLALRAELLGKEQGLPVEGIPTLAAAYKAAAAKLTEPPPKPKKEVVEASELAKKPPPPLPTWKKIYEKWWFWTIVSVGVAGAGAAVYGATRPSAAAPTGTPNSITIPFSGGALTAR
jgi:hypothetical protein